MFGRCSTCVVVRGACPLFGQRELSSVFSRSLFLGLLGLVTFLLVRMLVPVGGSKAGEEGGGEEKLHCCGGVWIVAVESDVSLHVPESRAARNRGLVPSAVKDVLW